ncbi:MAG: esterase [Planctomycetes bacterium]|nr:esterase [Planctomycetota bacterium]
MTVLIESFASRVLRGNPLGDPYVRRIPIYLPPSYARNTRRYPVIYVLSGFTGTGLSHLNWSAWGETLPERADRLIAEGRMREAILVMPDCFTRYGGSQYLNSSATGRYEDHLVRELVPWVDRRFRTIAHPEARAIMGKSSGGYGALAQAMRHPDVWRSVACHSGDMYFAYCYLPDFPKCLDALAKYGGRVDRFLRAWERMPKKIDGTLVPVVNTIAMAACYSPNPRRPVGFDLPFDPKTGELRPAVWRRWLAHDPVERVDRYARVLRRMRLLFFDCGTRDEFHLHYGARILSQRLRARGIRHIHEEFDDGHMNVQYRFDRSLVLLSRAISR